VERQLITPPTPRLLGAAYAAAFLGISPRTFEKLWRKNDLPSPHRIGRRLLWDVKALECFVDRLSGLNEKAEVDVDW
jgi:predicted DNA-binding transcriptional regulator AlpA